MTKEDLYLELADRIQLTGSKRIANLFKMIANEEEAELMLQMPGTIDQLSQKVNKSPDEVSSMVRLLFHKGLVFDSQKPEGTLYRMCRNLTQFHDASILWEEAPKEFLDAWQEYVDNEWPDLAAAIEKSGVPPFMRVIAVDEPVQGGTQILPFESTVNLIENSRSLAVTKCTCRLTAHRCDRPLEACIQLDKAADYSIRRGTGRSITKEEGIQILREAEEAGLVHTTENKAGMGHVICNCCGCCCQMLPVLIQHGRRLVDPSRFRARVEEDLCTSCEACLDRCFFEAIEMRDEVASIIEEKCMGCGLCGTTCPTEAITLVEVRPQDFIPA
ncbi:MAG: 4Fe-4S dicluster-binding protein [Desulfatiglans sp.]|jgi:Pyruvate/2-oxoacid:ferredoxin oxidoreductase delta subunit|nr:4Fe-4S binding protein [Thermodesulfobacteriota bacterium]MEE4351481.1 4Fe-4S dicluster-binding protein [Desulfatiglans sp.]